MAEPRFDPVLFDLDGTLVDSTPAIVASIREACRAVGVAVAPDRDLSWCVGPPLEGSLRSLVGDPKLVTEAIVAYRSSYLEAVRRESQPMPGAHAAVRALRAAGVTLAVVTYKPTPIALTVLARAEFDGALRHVTGRGPDRDDRPKAQLLRKALDDLRPHRAVPLYFGDHPDDRAAARACGVEFLEYGPTTWPQIVEFVLP